MNRNIAIIPARGGSKRIPRKNIKDFLGKPIIAYSIEAALKSNLFQEVMVSTDDDEIAAIGRAYGASAPFMRSKENSDDFSTTADVLLEVLDQYRIQFKRTFDKGCCIYPTAPLIKSEHIHQGYKLISTQRNDAVYPALAFSYPVWRGFEIRESGQNKFFWPENLNARSQDLKKVYHDAGQWYWFDCETLISKRALLTENTASIELSELEVQDIDTITDWALAELKFKLRLDSSRK